jgi:N-acetylglucosaminyldiphosphoundecaprenol N-acetyl-beta-D-mannosaminyltransferase
MTAIPTIDRSMNQTPIRDDLSREVYSILGVPIDAIEMPSVLDAIDAAAAHGTPFLMSTPNLNFLVNSQTDPEFRESLLLSDLCPADGMPIIWIARLLGVPIKRRIAGSDIFEALKPRPRLGGPLKIFLFGSTEQVAATACERLNYGSIGLKCVGWLCPGFVDVDALSEDGLIDQVNGSNADFLVAALGAKKGQLWLKRNQERLQVPVRAHLGATINFQAGTVMRAPDVVQRMGLEWLWRIKEEPSLFQRYWHDGIVLLRLLLTRVIPAAIDARRGRSRLVPGRHDFVTVLAQKDRVATLHVSGDATAGAVPKAIVAFRAAAASQKPVAVDLSQTRTVDARFLGLFLMLRKQLKGRGARLKFLGVSTRLKRQFRLNGLEYLLSSGEESNVNALR